MVHRSVVGRLGEDAAVRHLRKIGYEIRGRNIRIGRDEIDILAFDPKDQVLVFAEVKARSRLDGDFRPELNMDKRKIAALRRAARAWIAEHEYEGGYRMDFLSIVQGNVLGHLEQLSWGEQVGGESA